MSMKCAQCETADATLWCKDENLYYCEQCSGGLHMKKARMQHHVEPITAAPLCDECEVATGEVECLECGGNKVALVFCRECSIGLHSRVARRGHHVTAVSSLERKGEVENPISGRFVIDLTAIDSDEENRVPCSSSTEQFPRASSSIVGPVKKEKMSPPAKVAGGTNASSLNCLKGRVKAEADEEQIFPSSIGRKRKAAGNEEPKRRRKIEKSVEDEGQVKEEGSQMKKPTSRESKRSKPSGKQPTARPRKGDTPSPASDNGTDSEADGVHVIRRGAVSLEAFVVDAPGAEEEAEYPTSDAIPESNVESGIKNKIKNMLDLGLHPDTPEFEAQQALRNAQRLLTKYNLQQVEVMDGNLKDASSLTGGMRMVELRPKGRVKYGRMEFWTLELADVIRLNFDCQYFFKTATAAHPLRVVFYGIRQNANCAGYAFAAAFNRITIMSAAYVPIDDSETKQPSALATRRRIEMRVARANYRNGVVAGLRVALKKFQRQENEDASACKNTQAPAGECGVGAEDDHDDFTCPSDGEAELDDVPKKSTSSEACDSSLVISALVIHSKKVGEEFLKRKGIKIRVRTKRNRISTWNAEAFEQGKIDSKTIDINQKSITRGKGSKGSRQAKDEI